MTHTPGKWVDGIARGKRAVLLADEPASAKSVICTLNGTFGDYAIGQANARLIAASPMLLEALKICVNRLQCLEESGHGEAVINNALEAIAAAEGN